MEFFDKVKEKDFLARLRQKSEKQMIERLPVLTYAKNYTASFN
jgi:hypothetical protein